MKVEIRFRKKVEPVGSEWRPAGSMGVGFPQTHAIRPDPFTLRLEKVALCEVRSGVVLLRWSNHIMTCSRDYIEKINIE